jgi:hypothetical protein
MKPLAPRECRDLLPPPPWWRAMKSETARLTGGASVYDGGIGLLPLK